MTDTVFAWAVAASLGTHLMGLAAASALGLWSAAAATEPVPVPIEVVRVAAETPAPPPPPPRRAPRTPDPPKPKPVAEPAAPKAVENLLASPTAPALMDDATPKAPVTPNLPEQPFLTGNSLMARAPAPTPSSREGGEAGAGRLFTTGDIPVKAGGGVAGGSGARGRGGIGLSASGTGEGSGGAGGGTLTSLAHPIGGYQTSPHYPESARREGAEGITTLRFEVLTDGRVGTIRVSKSAGHRDLDQAAVDAVKTWRFEPARRGKEPVAVWVTLPVRFELKATP
jgi:protein TonB